MPDIINHAYLSTDLKVSRDCLCLDTTFYGSIYSSYFQAWIMKKHGPEASWTLLSRFLIDELRRCKYWVDLVYVTEEGNVLMEGTESFITQEKMHLRDSQFNFLPS